MRSFSYILATTTLLGVLSLAHAEGENYSDRSAFASAPGPMKQLPLRPQIMQGEPLKPPMGAVWTEEQRVCVEEKVGRPTMGTRPPSVAQMKIALADCGIQEPDMRAPASQPESSSSNTSSGSADSQYSGGVK